MNQPVDSVQREESLDTNHSFIVQAPAGSGKTSLLTQRYLRLLTTVRQPEEILAITFTRKAAAEMHERIIHSLALAKQPRPTDAHAAASWDIACEVLQHDADNEWNLLTTPNRLRVQTIDSLCANLTRQLPVTSRFGSPPSIQADANPLYIEAARNCLAELEGDDEIAEAIKLLLLHLDNQLSRAEQLISVMLASRDQWMRHLASGHSESFNRHTLEDVLQRSIESVLSRLVECFEGEYGECLQDLLAFAAAHIDDTDSAIYRFGEEIDLYNSDPSSLEIWQMLAGFLLTGAGSWRKQANAALGFPAPTGVKDKPLKDLYSEKKKQYKTLLAELSANTELTELMGWLGCLPSPQYSAQQWAFIQALFVVLPRSVAHLRLVFQYNAQVDFCEVSLSASQALHDASGVTDLALILDYQLQHILVDEFQDTSETQFSLLQDLTAGWQAGDGRTLFLVGDPMQSIYRFRQAEVGLFLKTQQQGLGEVREVNALNIAVNFRSQSGVVDWVNEVFKNIMPTQDDLYTGAISYKPSIAFNAGLTANEAVSYYPHIDRPAEGKALLELIQHIQENAPNESIGVLVRSRGALLDLLVCLNQAGIAYQASDIDPLHKRQTVIDLMSLSRAYLQAADRVAWLAVLRAPWCGLSLSDLLLLLEGAQEQNVWDLMLESVRLKTLSVKGQASLCHLIKVFEQAFSHRERISLADIIAGLWSQLFAPECLNSTAELSDAEAFFACLAELEAAEQSVDIYRLEQRLQKLYAAADVNAPAELQIMTIHKSKGLEFDHVILPGLDRQARHDDKRLLAWLERPSEFSTGSELLIAPLKATGSGGGDGIGRYLTKIEQEKSANESQRLLYVAVTRAKKQLHLSFCVSYDEKKQDIKTPGSNTLLGLLWPSISDEVVMPPTEVLPADTMSRPVPRLQRLNLHKVQLPPAQQADYRQPAGKQFSQQTSLLEFELSADLAAAIGTVCHQCMQIMGEQGIAEEPLAAAAIRSLLLEAGVLSSSLGLAVARVQHILRCCLKDKRGRWVLNNTHQDSQFELAISGCINNEIIHARLDRSFVDQGQRWIIDYKTSQFDGDDIESFLDQEMLSYKTQLERYARLMSGIDKRPIMLGLYYPEYAAWRSWEYIGYAD
ncbi:MAG: UvrD-helicase domain-containing protein [Cycloclasticus sp.]